MKKQEKPCLAMYIKTWFLFDGNKSSHFFFVVVVVACHNWFTHTHTYGWSAKNVCLLKKEYSSPLFHEHHKVFFDENLPNVRIFLGWNNFVLSGFQFFYKEMGFNALSKKKKKKRKEKKYRTKIYRHCFSWDFCKILQLLHHLYLMISSIDDDDDVGSVMITINLLWFDHTMDQHKKKKINSCQSCTVVSFLFFFVLLLPKLSLFSLPPIYSGWLCCIMMDFFFFFFCFSHFVVVLLS